MRRRFSLESVSKVTNTVIAYIYAFECRKRGCETEANEWEKKWYSLLDSLNDKEMMAYDFLKVEDIVDKEIIKFLSQRNRR